MGRVNMYAVLALVGVCGVISPARLSAQGAPALRRAAFFGGSGDQRGTSAVLRDTHVYVAGANDSVVTLGLLMNLTTALTPVWTTALASTQFTGLAATSSGLAAVGTANPPTCEASDGLGYTEAKGVVARYTFPGAPVGCGSVNFFPYRGSEGFAAVAVPTSRVSISSTPLERPRTSAMGWMRPS